MVQQNVQAQTSEAELHSPQNQWQQVTCVYQLEIKVLDIIDARCNHEV